MISMKNIFKLKSLLFFVMVMVFFTTNVLLSDLNEKFHHKGYDKKNKAIRKKNKRLVRRNKKNFPKKSIIVASQKTEAIMTDSIDKIIMQSDPLVIFTEGKNYIDQFSVIEKKFDNAIQVGDYYLKIPDGITLEEANSIVKNKLSLLLSMIMMAACNEYFHLGIIVFMSDEIPCYYDAIMSNKNKIKEAIESSKFYILSESPEIKKFIKSVIMLQLKTVLHPKEKESNINFSIHGNFVNTQIKEFLKNNNILNKVEVLKNIRKESDLDEEVIFLLAAMAYYVKNNNDLFLDSFLFHNIVTAVIIPSNFKFAKFDRCDQKEMRAIYQKILQLYDIKKICLIK